MKLEEQIATYFGLDNVTCEHLDIPVNDVVKVVASSGTFALKVYNSQSRTAQDVQWEMDLTAHLVEQGAPVVKPVRGRNGYVEKIVFNGEDRVAVLLEWAAGEKPKAEASTYVLLGDAAARIHNAADAFTSTLPREKYGREKLIDDQLRRMKNHLIEAGRWQQVADMAERLKKVIANPVLDWGVCHMDLKPDNVHVDGDKIVVFDFDSAGECWRALEAHGALRLSADYFKAWLEGYRAVRQFSQADEDAVKAFAVIGNLRVVAWDLGVAKSSRGKPLMDVAGLRDVADEWLEIENRLL